MNEVIDNIIKAISPASIAQATGATQRLLRAGVASSDPGLAAIAARLCAARHSPAPSLARKTLSVIASDHGIASPGIDMGEQSPGIVALRCMDQGKAAVNSAARSAKAQVVLTDVGLVGGDIHLADSSVLSFRVGNGTLDFREGPAMSALEVEASIQTGIALCFSLADAGLDLLGLGQVAIGSQASCAVITCALGGTEPEQLAPEEAALFAGIKVPNYSQYEFSEAERREQCTELLRHFGGFEIGVLAGMILAAASINVPVVLDGSASSTAALLAKGLSPNSGGYLIASHGGDIPAHGAALSLLGLSPIFSVGLAQGEGTAALLAMPVLEAALRVLAESAPR